MTNLPAIRRNREAELRQSAFTHPAVMTKLNELDCRIGNTTLNVPICNIPDSVLIEKIGHIANLSARDAGIRGKLEPYDLTRFMDILKKYYKELSLEEVKLAFELCIVGELDAFLPKDRNGEPDRNHYQVFSLEYVSKVLNSYRKKRSEIIGRAILMLPEKSKTLSVEEIKEIDDSVRRQLRDKFINYRDNAVLPVFYVPVATFLVLRDSGIISSIEYDTTKESIEKATVEILQDNTVDTKVKQEVKKYRESGTISSILKNRAGSIESQIRIVEIFNKLIADKTDINKLLNLE